MKTTILIPEYAKPNFLEVCLEALIKYSRYKHDILVVCGDLKASAVDFQYDNSGNTYQKYHNMEEFLKEKKKWMDDNNIRIIDATERRSQFKAEYERDGKIYHGGVDTSLKDNIGVEHVNTKLFFWNWDDDFIATPDWDFNLFKYIDESRHDRVYIPTHVQPAFGSGQEVMNINPKDVWTTSSHISMHRLALPITSRTVPYIKESELKEFVQANTRNGYIEELCHVRHQTHWVPLLIEKSLYQSMGGSNYQGPGYDIDFDDRLGARGIMRIMSKSSFIIHRAYMIWNV